MAIDKGNLFAAIPEKLSEELFNELVWSKSVRIERIVSKGHSSPASGWYDQIENEWVAVLQGEAKMAFENADEVHLVAGDHLTIPAHRKHKVTWTSSYTETVWLAVHYK